MALILNIDTASENASICLSANEKVLGKTENTIQKEHAAFLHQAIKQVMEQGNQHLFDLDAVAVIAGPGSYTGLRVGMATAKGLCYALKKPLITINTLEVMTHAAITSETRANNPQTLFCPMIDARRMEVYTALYDAEMSDKLSPCAMILEPISFLSWLHDFNIHFFGSGSEKFKSIMHNQKADFIHVAYKPENIAYLANLSFKKNQFADLAYAEPLYIKEFYTGNLLH